MNKKQQIIQLLKQLNKISVIELLTQFNYCTATALVVILSLLEYRIVLLFHESEFMDLIQAAYGVTIGYPHWSVYQSRVLGPFIVNFLSHIFNCNYSIAYIFFTMALHLIKNLLCFYLINSMVKNLKTSLKYTLVFIACFIAIQDERWFGGIYEARIYNMLIPFITFLALHFSMCSRNKIAA